MGVQLLARGELACHKSVSTGSVLAGGLIYKPGVWRSAGVRWCLHIRCENGVQEKLTRKFRGTPVGRRRHFSLLPAHSSALSDPWLINSMCSQINRICSTLLWLLLLPTGTKQIQTGSKTHYEENIKSIKLFMSSLIAITCSCPHLTVKGGQSQQDPKHLFPLFHEQSNTSNRIERGLVQPRLHCTIKSHTLR